MRTNERKTIGVAVVGEGGIDDVEDVGVGVRVAEQLQRRERAVAAAHHLRKQPQPVLADCVAREVHLLQRPVLAQHRRNRRRTLLSNLVSCSFHFLSLTLGHSCLEERCANGQD